MLKLLSFLSYHLFRIANILQVGKYVAYASMRKEYPWQKSGFFLENWKLGFSAKF